LVTDPYNTFVLPIFLKPGKQNFFVFSENATKWDYGRQLINCRKENVPDFDKPLPMGT